MVNTDRITTKLKYPNIMLMYMVARVFKYAAYSWLSSKVTRQKVGVGTPVNVNTSSNSAAPAEFVAHRNRIVASCLFLGYGWLNWSLQKAYITQKSSAVSTTRQFTAKLVMVRRDSHKSKLRSPSRISIRRLRIGERGLSPTPVVAAKVASTPQTITSSAATTTNSTFNYAGDVYACHATKFRRYSRLGAGKPSITGSTGCPSTTGGDCSNPHR